MISLDGALLKILLPAAGSVILLSRFGRSGVLTGIWQAPTARHVLVFGAIYVGWMVGTDILLEWRGPWHFSPWTRAPLLQSAWRVLGVCFAGPFLEELVFRGLLFGWLISRGLPAAATITLTALLWSVIHVDYSVAVVSVIFVARLILGLARHRSGSLLLPVALHIVWNLYAVW
jgi:membrane protease YdiL (CAAX protease family)